WLLFFTGFALAIMTKGAASVTLLLTALVLAALHPRHLLRHARTFTAGLLLFLVLTVPWHAFVYASFGHAFLRNYLGFHTLTRATNAIEGHRTHPWFYLCVLLVSAPLFSLSYPWAIARPFLNREKTPEAPQAPDPLQAFAVFALAVLLLFTAASTRLPHYIAPAYPALSTLTAALLHGWLGTRFPLGRAAAFRVTAAAVVLYAAAAFLTAKPRKALHNPQLRPGYTTPDNRESVSLLQALRHTSTPLPGGPLLVWRAGPVVPVTTDAFYAGRPAQQVSLAAPPAGLAPDPYFNDPRPLSVLLSSPHLLLIDRALLPRLPPHLTLQPIATGPTQVLAVAAPANR
ncbi:MAG TPA: hypothetical protein VKV02_02205, partial [Acidobacteriaceae bacterium]|nr:hypothetical protein [Acidobacteriaceae bacterium]